MKVWIVTDGEYSGYAIKGVFSTEARASEFKSAGGGDATEEHEMDSWQDDQGSWDFAFDRATNQIVSEEQNANLEPASDRARAYTWRPEDPIHVTVYTANRDRAVKIAAERFARIKAVWEDAVKASKMAQSDCGYPSAFILDIAEVMAGIEPPPEPTGSMHSNFVRKALGL